MAESPSQPPCEAVSWNPISVTDMTTTSCQPPCEAVSWNTIAGFLSRFCVVSLLVRLWVEILGLKQWPVSRDVSLLVRLWVEITDKCHILLLVKVSLLVRLWVEIRSECLQEIQRHVSLLVRLWVEIIIQEILKEYGSRQPPCEAVSWNARVTEN